MQNKKKQTNAVEDTTKYQNYLKATVTKTDMDGCSWMLVLEDGKKLEPINLTDEFKVNNQKVWLQYKNNSGSSICMMGQMISVTAIAKR